MRINKIGQAVIPEKKYYSIGYGEFAAYYKLLLRVMIQQIDDLLRGDSAERVGAKIYFNSQDGVSLFSFLSICSYCNLDAERLKKGIERLEKNRIGWKESHKSLFYGDEHKEQNGEEMEILKEVANL